MDLRIETALASDVESISIKRSEKISVFFPFDRIREFEEFLLLEDHRIMDLVIDRICVAGGGENVFGLPEGFIIISGLCVVIGDGRSDVAKVEGFDSICEAEKIKVVIHQNKFLREINFPASGTDLEDRIRYFILIRIEGGDMDDILNEARAFADDKDSGVREEFFHGPERKAEFVISPL